jgi:hypothetical protein
MAMIETMGGSEALKDHAGTIHSMIQKYGVAEFNNLIDVLESGA